MPKLCIGLLTHCDDSSDPERFDILKKSVDSLAGLASPDVYIYVWDNNSSPNVRAFLKEKKFFNALYLSDSNLYDVVAVHKLVQEASDIGAEYVCHLEDDFFFYKNDFVQSCIDFLDTNKDCGYLRILKYEFDKKHKYDKFLKHPELDPNNGQRHHNQITKEKLAWEDAGSITGFSFYKNNWHWYNYANICRLDVFRSIIPYADHKPLQDLEGYMMKNYHDLGLKTGVLDGGVVTHLGNFTPQTSQRVKLQKQYSATSVGPTILYTDVEEEIKAHGLSTS